MSRRTLAIFTILAMASASTATAQVNRELRLRFESPPLMSLELDRSSLDFSLPKEFKGEPLEKAGAVAVRIKSNVSWELTTTASGDLTNTENKALTIPCSRLEFRCQSADASISGLSAIYQPFSLEKPALVARGEPTPNHGTCLYIDLRFLASLSDPAGTYSLSLTYTLSQTQ